MTTNEIVTLKTNELTAKLIRRWAFFTATLGAIIIGIIYLSGGSVGYVSEITFKEKTILMLPFRISRWWDILWGPIFSTVTISFFSWFWGDFDKFLENPKFNKVFILFISWFFFAFFFALGELDLGGGLANALFYGFGMGILAIPTLVFIKYFYLLFLRPIYYWLSGN